MIIQSSGTSSLESRVYSLGTKYLPLDLTFKSVFATGTDYRLIDTGERQNTRRETCPSATSSATNATYVDWADIEPEPLLLRPPTRPPEPWHGSRTQVQKLIRVHKHPFLPQRKQAFSVV